MINPKLQTGNISLSAQADKKQSVQAKVFTPTKFVFRKWFASIQMLISFSLVLSLV